MRSLSEAEEAFAACELCPRRCRVNRLEGKKGFCQVDATLLVARAALHFWEEPCISGTKGSGAVFFSGCSLRCAYCQNQEISDGKAGGRISPQRLSEIFLELQEKGAANLNLVTAAHFVPWVIWALEKARDEGFCLPVVYNSSGYESLQTLSLLDGLVDVYLPDMKYADAALAESLSGARDYPEVALRAIGEMIRQTGDCVIGEDGYITRGTIVRHLILPGHVKNSRRVLALLEESFGKELCISLMNQYTPMLEEGSRLFRVSEGFPELLRRVTPREYDRVLDYCLDLGMEKGYFQEGDTAKESFIPPFDGEGVL